MNKQMTIKEIAKRLAKIDVLMDECEHLALKGKVDFSYQPPTGSYIQFDGAGEYNDGKPLGWDQSQC